MSAQSGVVAVLTVILVSLGQAPASANCGGVVTSRVNVSSAGRQANFFSAGANLSASGRFAVFSSLATNLVAGDSNAAMDVFVRDRLAGTTRRVSVSSTGAQGNDTSSTPSISADGRYVAFASAATNLVPGDTNGGYDVFVRDLRKRTTSRVSLSGTGAQVSAGSRGELSMSADGRYVTFTSSATDLVPGQTNGGIDVYVRDRVAGTTNRVSDPIGTGQRFGSSINAGPAISADGRFVAFWSDANDLVPSDTNGTSDVFVRDRVMDTMSRISVASSGRQGNAESAGTLAISANGRYVAFESLATNLVAGDTNGVFDVFLRDRQTSSTSRVSVSSSGAEGDGMSVYPSLSADGRYVAFGSYASDLVPGDTNSVADVFVRDRRAGTTRLMSVSSSGARGNLFSNDPSISAKGEFVQFTSEATNLVPGDTNNQVDVFVRRL